MQVCSTRTRTIIGALWAAGGVWAVWNAARRSMETIPRPNLELDFDQERVGIIACAGSWRERNIGADLAELAFARDRQRLRLVGHALYRPDPVRPGP